MCGCISRVRFSFALNVLLSKATAMLPNATRKVLLSKLQRVLQKWSNATRKVRQTLETLAERFSAVHNMQIHAIIELCIALAPAPARTNGRKAINHCDITDILQRNEPDPTNTIYRRPPPLGRNSSMHLSRSRRWSALFFSTSPSSGLQWWRHHPRSVIFMSVEPSLLAPFP